MVGQLGPVTRAELARAAEQLHPGKANAFTRALERLSIDLLVIHGRRRYCQVTQRLTKTWVINPKKSEVLL
jgi:hypothetical protein